MSNERVPHVVLTITRPWRPLSQAVKTVTINSDAATTRAKEAAEQAILEALRSKVGYAVVKIEVRRKAKKPTGVRIIGDAEDGP